jgi:hypothetical protein
MAIGTTPGKNPTMNMGSFTPWQSQQGGNKGGTYQRMAGDYMDEFTQNNPEAKEILENPKKPSNVMQTLGASNSTSSDSSNATQANNSDTNSAPTPTSTQSSPSVNSDSNASNTKYDEDKYKYYASDFGTGTGAEAYAKDMELHEKFLEMNKTGATAGHLGLVAQMFHPDWGASQTTAANGPQDITLRDHSKPDPNDRKGTKWDWNTGGRDRAWANIMAGGSGR